MTLKKTKKYFPFSVLIFKLIPVVLAIFLLIFKPNQLFAAEPNNKYGMHLAQPHLDALEETAKLVNSNGGDWGYVTLVIQENDRKNDKWQEIFNRLRKLHLIPIIRLATSPEGEVWRRPKKEEAKDWVNFLSGLNWVTKKRYVVLFNEPNHGAEWGGEIDPANYAEVAMEFAKKFRERSPDYFVIMAGFDASAPSWPPGMESEDIFLRKVIEAQPTIFDQIGGWASHSYPNPGFAGSPWDSGRGTIRTYEWELGLLKNLGVNKDLPVFITETGWKRGTEKKVADDFQLAFEDVWGQDSRVMAVTPFVLDYQGPPFLEFSWKKLSSPDFYQQYYSVQSLAKEKGEPAQFEKGSIDINLPKELVEQSNYHFRIRLKNSGQAVWDKNDKYELRLVGSDEADISYLADDLKNIMPFEEKDLNIFLKTGNEGKRLTYKFDLEKNGKKILESAEWKLKISPLPVLNFQVNLFPKLNDKGNDFEIQIFDQNENLVFRKKNLEVYGGKGVLLDIQNVVVGDPYRIVILKPYYLPRQSTLVLAKNKNETKFKIMIPFDFNKDGKLSIDDLFALIKDLGLLKLFIP